VSEADERRTAAQWTTLVISSLLLLAVVTLLVRELLADQSPAAPVATVEGAARRLGDRYVVDVVVVNHGDDTAANAQVTASLDVDGEVTEADQLIDFLAGGAEERLSFAFDDDPADGELTVAVSGYADP
jgi:uncharacterized protein (TIGR02588 family)